MLKREREPSLAKEKRFDMNYSQMEQQYGIGVYPSREITLVSGSDATVWDDRGREYIDCTAGIGVGRR